MEVVKVSRKKETIIYIILIFVFVFLYMKLTQSHFSPEGVLRANEYGLHYGPSEKVVLKYPEDKNEMLVIGKIDDRALSVIPARRSLFVLWKLKSGGAVSGYTGIDNAEDSASAWYSSRYGLIYGITDLDEASRAQVRLMYKNNSMEDFENTSIYEMDVDQDGFFFCAAEAIDNESWYYTEKITIYNDSGDILFNKEFY